MTSEDLLKSIKRVKIVCKEGLLRATKIYTEDGHELRVTNLDLRLDDGIWVAWITMWRAELDLSDVVIGQKLIQCHKCKQLEDITEPKIEDSPLQKSEVSEKL